MVFFFVGVFLRDVLVIYNMVLVIRAGGFPGKLWKEKRGIFVSV